MTKDSLLKIIKKSGTILGFFIAIFLVVFGVYKISGLQNNSQVTSSIVKGFSITQIPSAPGQPIKWIKKIAVNQINKDSHLVEIPKVATKVTVSTSTLKNISKIKISKLTNADRKKLSALAAKRIHSTSTLEFAEKIKQQNAAANKKLSFLGKIFHNIANTISNMFATVEDAVAPAPEPETTVVDVAPVVSPTPDQTPTPTPTDNSSTLTPDNSASVQSTSTDNSQSSSTASTTEDESTTTASTTEDQSTTSASTTIDQSTTTTSTSTDNSQSSSTTSTSSDQSTATSTGTSTASTTVDVTFETPAPTITEANTDTGKIVTISATDTPETQITDVLAFTNIPKIYKVGQEDKIKIKWVNNGDQNVVFKAYDLNKDGWLDYVEWTVPHLSTQTFEIIFISKAFQLDTDQSILADIYDTVATKDGNYATINDGQYIRTTFNSILSNKNDITIYARPSGTTTSASIEVYPVYTDANGDQTEGPQLALVDDNVNPNFDNINHNGKYRILLQNLQTPTDMFDLKVIGNIDVDYVVDPSNPFISTWDTTKAGSASSVIVLPITGTYVVDWGDNSTSSTATHTYTGGNTGTTSVTISITGTPTSICFNYTGDYRKIKNISQWGILKLGNSGAYFYGAPNLTITATDTLDMTGTTNMSYAFDGAGSITSIPSINSWDMSNVTNMAHMFDSAGSFNQDISGWNTGNVTNMSYMFQNTNLFDANLGAWNTSKVINMAHMFDSALAFNNASSSTINNWVTASTTDMSYMFEYTKLFNQPIGSWNTSNVTNIAYMFDSANSFNQNINTWNTGNVTNMQGVFYNNGQTVVFNQPIGNWNTSKVTDMSQMFYQSKFNQDISGWNTASSTSMASMFGNDSNFNQDLSNWNTGNVTSMRYMFMSTKFNYDVSKWNTSKVTDMYSMFNGDAKFNQNVGSWDVSNVTNMGGMFSGAGGVFNNAASSSIGNWNTSNVTDMSQMFYYSAFNQNISGWNTAKVTTMNYMFGFDSAFNQNLGNWVVSSSTNMSNMFTGDTLSTINYSKILQGWSTQTLKSPVTFTGGSSQYYTGTPATARAAIVAKGWTINDGGSVAPTTFNDVANGNWQASTTWGTSGTIEGVAYPGPYDIATIDSNTVTLVGNQYSATTTVSGSGTLNLAGYQFSPTVFNVSANLKLTGDETAVGGSALATPTLTSSTVTYTATTSTRAIKDWSYNNLTINGSGGTFTVGTSNLTIPGNLTLSAGTFTAPSGTLNVGGNWTNSGGTFSSNSGSVNLNGTAQSIIGANSFNNLTKTTSAATSLLLDSLNTTTITNNLTLNGALNNLLSISPIPGGIDSYTKLMLHMDGANNSSTFTDSSSGLHTFTSYSSTIDTSTSVFGGASGNFPVNKYISTPASSDFNLGSGDFTIDFRVRLNSTGGSYHFVTFYGQEVSANDFSFNVNMQDGTHLQFAYTTTGSSATTLGVSYAFSTNTWYHIAISRTGGKIYFFVNGVLQNVGGTTFTATIYTPSTPLRIGWEGYYTGSPYYLDGHLDEFRISKGVARWTSNFTPPTSSYFLANTFNLVQTGAGTTNLSYLNVASSTNLSSTAFLCTTGCVDGGGNTNWTFDITPPTINLGSVAAFTSNTTPTIYGTSTDAGTLSNPGIVSNVQYQIDGTSGSWINCTAADGAFNSSTEGFSCTASTLADGSHTIYVRATDAYSNTTSNANAATSTFTVDTVPPTVNAGANKTANSTFTTTATASDVTSGIASYLWSKVSGPGTITFGSSTSANTTISANTDGTYVIKLLVTDNVGNSSSSTFNLIWDTTSPVVSAGSNMTSSSTFTTSASSSDLTSGIASYLWSKVSGPGTITFGSSTSANTTISANTDGTYVIKLLATDNAGNLASSTFSLTWDTVAPSSVSSNADNNWHTSPIVVTLSCTDSTSGCNQVYYCTYLASTTPCTPDTNYATSGTSFAFTYSTEGDSVLRYKANDFAGNTTSIYTDSNDLKFDNQLPTVTVATSTFANASTVTFTCDDGVVGSGCYRIYYTTDNTNPSLASQYVEASSSWQFTITSEGDYVLKYFPVDIAGNSGQIITGHRHVDKTAPNTSDNFTNNNIWVNGNQTITLTPNDPAPSSGILWTRYCVDTNNTCSPADGTDYSAPVVIPFEGISYFRYASEDNANNIQTTVSRIVKIDTVAPMTTDTAVTSQTQPYTYSAWTNSNITITLNPADTTSGIATTSYCIDNANTCTPSISYVASVVVSNGGTNYFRYSSIDNAGNIQTIVSRIINIDKTLATISNISPVDNSNIYTGNLVTFTLSKVGDCRLVVSDTAQSYDQMSSGVSCSVNNGIQMSCILPTLGTPGPKNVYIACQDYLGNKDTSSSATHMTYAVPSGRKNYTTASSSLSSISGGGSSSPRYSVSINGGAWTTDDRKVTLQFSTDQLGSATAIIFSNNPDFTNTVTIPYSANNITTTTYDLCQNSTTCPDGKYYVYAKFLDAQGISSPAVSQSITLSTVSIINSISNTTQSIVGNIASTTADILTVILPPKKIEPLALTEVKTTLPSVAPFAILNSWKIITPSSLTDLINTKLPSDYTDIVSKFPEVSSALSKIGVNNMNSILKLNANPISLPGITEAATLSSNTLPIASLSDTQKAKIPTGIVFARTQDEKIDLNVKLSIGNDGLALQTLNTIQGQTMKLIVKPTAPAKNIQGYIIFKSNAVSKKSTLSQVATVASTIIGESQGTQTNDSGITSETDLVLTKFNYKENVDGIWTADVASPLAIGQYELRTVVNFKAASKAPEKISMVVLVDPEGYVYEKQSDGKETRLNNVEVSIYWQNPKTKNYELWPAKDYRQTNPQTTDVTGRYSFLVPAGIYYMTAHLDGYVDYKGDPFQVDESKGVFMNLELKAIFSVAKILNLQNILLLGIFVALVYIGTIFTIRRGKGDKRKNLLYN